MNPFIIGVAGESGVGKSTIAEIIALYYGIQNCLILSTDDLHKYSRHDPAWQYITHLHPNANNLEMGNHHLQDLKAGRPIWRSKYNHSTGHFDAPVKVEPKPFIIIEGLHAFYTETSQRLIDLKIYVNTDEELCRHWKILRDTEQRGYRYNEVIDTINRRQKDAEYVKQQMLAGVVDVIILMQAQDVITEPGNKYQYAEISLKIIDGDKPVEPVFDFIKRYTEAMNLFFDTCSQMGYDYELCQGAGGNVSIKVDQYMIIKASGVALRDVNGLSGWSVIEQAKIPAKEIDSEEELIFYIDQAKAAPHHARPSMETAMHSALNEKVVLHCHPVYLTLLLCLQDSEQIIKDWFSLNFKRQYFAYISYTNPGHDLYKAIKYKKRFSYFDTYFLENHGVTLAGSNMQALIDRLKSLNDWAKDWITKQLKKSGHSFQPFNLSFADRDDFVSQYAFPDAILFAAQNREVRAMHNYINTIGPLCGTVRHLSAKNVDYIKNMEAEKYRQKA